MSNARQLANFIGRLSITSAGAVADTSGDVRSIPQIIKTAGLVSD